MRASLLCMVAMTFKVFPIFIFLPLLLLLEKRVFRIIGYTAIAVSGYLFFNLLFSGSEMFKMSRTFQSGMMHRLFFTGLSTEHPGTLSFFLLAYIAALVFTWFTDTDGKDNFTFQKYALYIPLWVYSAFFSFVFFHPQWVLILAPYLVVNIFINRNTKGFMFIAMAANLALLLHVMSAWAKRNDFGVDMVNLGFFRGIYGSINTAVDGGANSLRVHVLAVLNRIVPLGMGVYLSFFVGMLLVNLALSFPGRGNIRGSRNIVPAPFTLERDIVWISGMIVLLAAIILLLLFFTFTKG